MYAIQVKLLVTLAVVIAAVLWLAASAVPAVAGAASGTVSVGVTVRTGVALTLSEPADATGATIDASSITLTSNVDCYVQPHIVERNGTTFSVLTVVPSR